MPAVKPVKPGCLALMRPFSGLARPPSLRGEKPPPDRVGQGMAHALESGEGKRESQCVKMSGEVENVERVEFGRIALSGLLLLGLGCMDAEAGPPLPRRTKPIVIFPAGGASAPVPPMSVRQPETPPLSPEVIQYPTIRGSDARRSQEIWPQPSDEPSLSKIPVRDDEQPGAPEAGRVESAQPERDRLREGQLEEVRPIIVSPPADRVYDRAVSPMRESYSGIWATTRNERGEIVYLSPRRDAISVFSTVSTPDPNSIDVRSPEETYTALSQAEMPESLQLRRAQALALSGRRQEAIALLQKPLPDTGQAAQRAYLLGTLHEEMGNIAEALSYLHEAARLRPNSADTWYNLGLTCELAGQRDQAYQHYRRAQILEPNAVDIRKALERTLP